MSETTYQAGPDAFDRLLGQLDGLPDVTRTRQSIVRVLPPLGVGGSETFIVQTMRQRGGEQARSRDTIFLEHVRGGAAYRLVIPAEVADLIARQRDQLTTANRVKQGRRVAEDRKARGEAPAFSKRAAS